MLKKMLVTFVATFAVGFVAASGPGSASADSPLVEPVQTRLVNETACRKKLAGDAKLLLECLECVKGGKLFFPKNGTPEKRCKDKE